MMIEQQLSDVTDRNSVVFEGTIALTPVYKEEIARVLDLIALDSRRLPERYLQETMVPHGGE